MDDHWQRVHTVRHIDKQNAQAERHEQLSDRQFGTERPPVGRDSATVLGHLQHLQDMDVRQAAMQRVAVDRRALLHGVHMGPVLHCTRPLHSHQPSHTLHEAEKECQNGADLLHHTVAHQHHTQLGPVGNLHARHLSGQCSTCHEHVQHGAGAFKSAANQRHRIF